MKMTQYLDKKLDECFNNIDNWKDIHTIGRIVIGIRKNYGNYTISVYEKSSNNYKKILDNDCNTLSVTGNTERKWYQFKSLPLIKNKYYISIIYCNGNGWIDRFYKDYHTDDQRIDKIIEYLNEEKDKKEFMKHLPESDQKNFENEVKQYDREKKLNRILDDKS